MNRAVVPVLVLQILSTGLLLPSGSEASDGDVDYSAPYITVDPKTGELVTVNPGPRPKMHDLAVASSADGRKGSLGGSGSKFSAADGQADGGLLFPLLSLAAATIAGGFLAVKIRRPKKLIQNGRQAP